MAAENGFLINGTLYEVPTLDSLNGDEAVILFDYSGLVQEDFVPQDGEDAEDTNQRNQRQMKHPGFWLALMHIAYRRQHPELKPEKVKQLIGSVNRWEALSTLAGDTPEGEEDGGGAVPPASTSEPDGSSPNGSLENTSSNEPRPANGGDGSTNGSEGRVVPLASTTTTR